MLKNHFTVDSNHAAKMEELIARVKKSNTAQIVRALKSQAATEASAPAASGNPNHTSTGPNRTTCQPHFTDDDKPIDITRVVDLASIPASDFQSTHEFLSSR